MAVPTREWLDLVIARTRRNIASAREHGHEDAARYWEGSLAAFQLVVVRLDGDARKQPQGHRIATVPRTDAAPNTSTGDAPGRAAPGW